MATTKKMRLPHFIEPMKAYLTEDYFSDKDWIFEEKLDGERCLVIKDHGKVILKSRNNLSLNETYPELVAALERQKADNFVVDGEIVAMGKNKKIQFSLLQERWGTNKYTEESRQKITIKLYLFDALYVGGKDIRREPLLKRKQQLKKIFRYNKLLKFTEHKTQYGLRYYRAACTKGWEGIMAKKADSPYTSVRSRNWLKFKCSMEQELVIGGYTTPQGERSVLGALLVGFYKKGKLYYAGKVGTGYNEATLQMLGKLLKSLQKEHCPFVDYDKSEKGVHWVSPKLVAQFKFAEWTRDNKLRHARYLGLRNDKAAKDVVQELPK